MTAFASSRRTALGGLIVLALLLVPLLAVAASNTATLPTLALKPAEGPPAISVRVTGEGHMPCVTNGYGATSVALFWDGRAPPLVIATGATGRFSASFSVPADAAAGPHVVSSSCWFHGDPAGPIVSATFVVQGTLALSPAEGPPGTTVAIQGDGFPPVCLETIDLRFDGRRRKANFDFKILKSVVGFTGSFDVPDPAADGPHDVSIHCPAGEGDPALAIASFEVPRVPPPSSSTTNSTTTTTSTTTTNTTVTTTPTTATATTTGTTRTTGTGTPGIGTTGTTEATTPGTGTTAATGTTGTTDTGSTITAAPSTSTGTTATTRGTSTTDGTTKTTGTATIGTTETAPGTGTMVITAPSTTTGTTTTVPGSTTTTTQPGRGTTTTAGAPTTSSPPSNSSTTTSAIPTTPTTSGGRPPPAPELTRSLFPASLRAPREVPTSLGRVLRSAALAMALVLLVGFPAEIFNKTLEENYDEIRSWFDRRRPGRRAWRIPQSAQVALFAVLSALLLCLVDPSAAPDRKTVALVLGFLVAVPLMMLYFEQPMEAYYTRVSGLLSTLRVLPLALAVAVACALLSRLAHFQPGYVYGLFAGYAALRDRRLASAQEGRGVLIGALWALGVSVLAWLVWGASVSRAAAGPHPSFGLLVLDATLSSMFVLGVEGIVFALIPLHFLYGHKLARWSRTTWAIMFGVGVFGWIHILLDTKTEEAGVAPLASMLILFGAFGAFSVAFWAYFRYRPRPGQADEPLG
jgi:hypothetical protein